MASLCYAALYPDTVKNLIATVTPTDFYGDVRDDQYGLINLWTRSLQPEDIDMVIDACGNMPSELISLTFSMMMPVMSMTKYNTDLLGIAHNGKALMDFLRFEKWLSDCPDHPGEAAKQRFKDCYQDNKLLLNELELGGKKVNLAHITMPVLNVYALSDHIIPPECSKPLKEYIGSEDCTDMPLQGGMWACSLLVNLLVL